MWPFGFPYHKSSTYELFFHKCCFFIESVFLEAQRVFKILELFISTAKAPRLCKTEPIRALIIPKADKPIIQALIPIDNAIF